MQCSNEGNKYVVFNETALGYILDTMPDTFGILFWPKRSQLDCSQHITDSDIIRKATPLDFVKYRVSLPQNFFKQ